MKTLAATLRKIESVKSKLIKQAQKNGLTENFGQSEVMSMRDNENYNPFGTAEQRQISSAVNMFDDWCMSYEG